MKLTAAQRKKLPNSAFAGPNRSYPVQDEGHAKAAMARASEMYHKGRLSKTQMQRIDAKARHTLGIKK